MTYWLTEDGADLAEFARIVTEPSRLSDFPHAKTLDQGVIIYEAADLPLVSDDQARKNLMAEISHALMSGPGVVAFRGAFPDTAVVDRVSQVFNDILESQHASGTAAGDHFAKPGANDRIWNALEKLALRDPSAFIDYYANDVIALASRSWLGPDYQVTSQVNVVNPGGVPQIPHCDYHLGFMGHEQTEKYPAQVQRLSPVLTLQGAIAHCDMPLATGPTVYLPHSQKFEAVYLAWRRPDFQEFIAQHQVQLELKKGDAVFFNPALIHGAGANKSSDVFRMANLLQVSSAFGRAIETVDRTSISMALYPHLVKRHQMGTLTENELANTIAASAEGYPFPTNLDRDQPIDGLAPPSQAKLMHTAIEGNWDSPRFVEALRTHANKRMTS